MWFYLRKDREHPEPWSLIAKVFFLGVAVTIPAIAFEYGLDYLFGFSAQEGVVPIVLSAFIIVAPVEEFFKFLVVREVVFKNPHFDEPVDGVMYTIVAALGFATLENILVVFAGGGSVVFLRFATATLMHALASGIVGYHIGLGMVQSKRKKALLRQGLILAIILHALYNTAVILTDNIWLIAFLVSVLLGVMFYIVLKGIQELKMYNAGG